MAGNDTGQRHRRAGGRRPQVPPMDGLNCHLGPGQPGQLVLILAGATVPGVICWPDNHYQTTVVRWLDTNLQSSELTATTYMASGKEKISLFPYAILFKLFDGQIDKKIYIITFLN